MGVRNGTKIGMTGAGMTGKTTDATFLAEQLGIPMLKSSSRQVYEKLKITEAEVFQMSNDDKWQLQERIFTMKTLNDDQSFEFVADRTLLDHWAYCLMYCGGFLPNDKFKEFEINVRKHMRATYTHLFYHPWGFWAADPDGVRSDQWAWQSAIDAIITGYCVRWNLPVVQVPQTQGKEARQEYILKTVLGENK